VDRRSAAVPLIVFPKTSAKTNVSIEEAFQEMSKKLIEAEGSKPTGVLIDRDAEERGDGGELVTWLGLFQKGNEN
jgi:hypothetical protein